MYHLRNQIYKFNYIPSSDYAIGTNDRKEDESFNLYNLFSLSKNLTLKWTDESTYR